MSSISLAPRRPVLADRALPAVLRRSTARSVATDAALVVGGAALTALLAQVAVPMWPVPITGQTFAVLVVGATLGGVRGAASMLLYAVAGVLGAPVFAEAHSGAAAVVGPTGGYIVGFVFAAALTGWLAQHRFDRTLLRGMLAFVAGSVVVFAFGLPWLAITLGLTWQQTLQVGLLPFVAGGAVKAFAAALVLRGAWRLVDRADRSA